MTRKHFQALAQALHDARPLLTDKEHMPETLKAREHWAVCVDRIADVCAETNSRFDRIKFVDACEWGS